MIKSVRFVRVVGVFTVKVTVKVIVIVIVIVIVKVLVGVVVGSQQSVRRCWFEVGAVGRCDLLVN